MFGAERKGHDTQTHKNAQLSGRFQLFPPLAPSLWINRGEQRTVLLCFEECKYLSPGCWSFLSLATPQPPTSSPPHHHPRTRTNTRTRAAARRKLGQTVNPWIRGCTFSYLCNIWPLWNFQHFHVYTSKSTRTRVHIHTSADVNTRIRSNQPLCLSVLESLQ